MDTCQFVPPRVSLVPSGAGGSVLTRCDCPETRMVLEHACSKGLVGDDDQDVYDYGADQQG
jgi:hypothetical protein